MNNNAVTIANKQIVSVALITYHSSVTVLETLDSIVNQSYGSENIELIISDDGSRDNTVQVINGWLVLHQAKFNNVRFFANEINRGISKNCNVAWKNCTSRWIKTIAGDDLLQEKCISSFIKYVDENNDAMIVFSRMIPFVQRGNEMVYLKVKPMDSDIKFFDYNAKKQHRYLLTRSFNMAPTSFIRKDVLEVVGYADENFRLIEDLPLWLKLTKSGARLYFNDEVLVYYRISDSLSNSTTRFINVEFEKEIVKLHSLYIKHEVEGWELFLYYDKLLELKSNILISRLVNNKRGLLSFFLNKLVSLFRPRWYRAQLKRKQGR